MRVKALAPHSNGYGKPFSKRKGSIYDHPAPHHLIKIGLITPYENKSKVRGRKGAGKSVDGIDGSNSQERDAESGSQGS